LHENGRLSLYGTIEASLSNAELAIDLLIIDAMFRSAGASFDQNNFVPGRLQLSLAMALRDRHDEGKIIPTVLLFDEHPQDEDVVCKLLQPAIDDGKLAIVDRSGRITGSLLSSEDANLAVGSLDGSAVKQAQSLLHQKMIRRVGHFRRKLGDHMECTRYFYDGSRCTDEIRALLADFIKRRQPDAKLILYDTTVSRWLQAAADETAVQLGIGSASLSSLLADRDTAKPLAEDRAVLVLPLVDAGYSLEALFRRWHDLLPDTPFPAIASVMCTVTDVPPGMPGRRSLPIKPHSVEVEYFLGVDRGLRRTPTCQCCALKMPFSSFEEEDFDLLPAFDFWELVEAHAWIDERDVPDARATIGRSPDFREVFRDNGAWLASVALRRIRNEVDRLGNFQAPFVLVALDELGSEAFARAIALLHAAASVVLIPRPSLEAFADGDYDLDFLVAAFGAETPRWFLQLRDTEPRTPVIFAEEFTRSGSTSRAVARLVLAVRRSVVSAHTLICDFRPSERHPDDPPIRLALYEFELSAPEAP
jgi:hypothetical protein